MTLTVDCEKENENGICPNKFKPLEKIDSNIMKIKPDYQFILPFYFHYYEKKNNFDNIYDANKTNFPEFFGNLKENIMVLVIQ